MSAVDGRLGYADVVSAMLSPRAGFDPRAPVSPTRGSA
jgi:hypothetical protein